jgi:hypothetical protein
MKTSGFMLALAGALLLSACGSEEAAPPPVVKAPAPKPIVAADNPAASMAKAVSTAKSGAAVELRYEIGAKPAVGVPFDVDLALVSGADTETMTVVIAGMPGLTVADEVVAPLTDVVAGQVYPHKFTALVDQPGVYYISVTVTTLSRTITQARTFSIPVLVGDPAVARKPTVEPQKDAKGQAIQSMPAEETTRPK